jgi:CRISPR-associated protein Csd1
MQGGQYPAQSGRDIVRAILADQPYPAKLLSAAVQRCRAERQITYTRAALINARLNRVGHYQPHPEKEFLPMLNLNNPHPAHRLGRLFAALEKCST